MHKELTKADATEWHLNGLKALFQFAFQIMISNLNSYLNDAEFASVRLQNILPELDDDETLINKSIESNVFAFINNSILSNQRFYSEVKHNTLILNQTIINALKTATILFLEILCRENP